MPAKPQFSLRALFVAIAAAFLPPVLVAGAFYARGFSQAFCIGALTWLVAAHWIARISIGVPTTQGIELTGPSITGMGGGMGGMKPPGLLSQPNSPYFEQLGLRYRSGYCALWLLTIVGGLVAVVVRWLTVGTSDAPTRSGDRV